MGEGKGGRWEAIPKRFLMKNAKIAPQIVNIPIHSYKRQMVLNRFILSNGVKYCVPRKRNVTCLALFLVLFTFLDIGDWKKSQTHSHREDGK